MAKEVVWWGCRSKQVIMVAGDWGQSDERVLQCRCSSSNCSCQLWDLTASSQHAHLFIASCLLMAVNCLQAPMCEKGLLSLREMPGRREPQPHAHFLFPLPLPFQYSYITPQVFPLAQSLAAVLEQSGHHCSFTFPGTKPSCITMVCPYSVRSPAALELCLIGIGSFMDRGVPVQSFHPAVL